jgi:DNA-binding NarL/FixJ family response regulator
MTTILIADNHEVVRCGVHALLAERPDWKVKEAVAQAIKTTPDVAIIDYSLPFLNGVEVTKQIRERSPDTAVLIFTMHDNNFVIRDSLRAGALGYVHVVWCSSSRKVIATRRSHPSSV